MYVRVERVQVFVTHCSRGYIVYTYSLKERQIMRLLWGQRLILNSLRANKSCDQIKAKGTIASSLKETAAKGIKNSESRLVPWLSSVLWARLREWITDAGFSDRADAIFCGKSLETKHSKGKIELSIELQIQYWSPGLSKSYGQISLIHPNASAKINKSTYLGDGWMFYCHCETNWNQFELCFAVKVKCRGNVFKSYMTVKD